MITVRYSTIDHFTKTRRFKTLAGARRFAQRYLGERPELGRLYAVSGDGWGKIEAEGCLVSDLFPALSDRVVLDYELAYHEELD